MTAPALAVADLSLRLGGFALQQIDLRVEAGEILVVLGPNGAGKSLTLETIAGFHRPDRGRIAIAGRDVTRLPPEHRHVGLLFQDFGLFPHLDLAGNIALGLHAGRARGRRRDLQALLAHFGLTGLARRRPSSLSPGEKQRAALARALAAEPDVFLLDEPFSALDMPTRDRLRRELAKFLHEVRVATVFVTHDRGEAAQLADRVAVMRGGRIVQTGPAEAVFEQPASRFVAEFVGFENILEGRVAGRSGEILTVELAGREIRVAAPALAADPPRYVRLCIRAENIDLYPLGGAPGHGTRISGRTVALDDEGALTRVAIDCGFPLRVCAMTRQLRALRLARGAEIEAVIAPGAVHIIPADLITKE